MENENQRLYSAWTDLDLDRDGVARGTLFVSQSTDRSAYQALRVPLMCIRNGDGPSTLLMAGNHGDEFEGQIVLSEIASRTDLAEIRGRVIIMPRANEPACAAGARTSPVDGGNFNIAFPGIKGGPVTQQIAHFLEETVLPRVDLWIDLHSGGRTLVYEPLAAMHASQDRDINRQTVALMGAFGAPRNLVFTIQEARAASSAAQRHKVKYIYGEYGGGAALVNGEGVAIALAGVERILAARHGYRAPAPAPAATQEWLRIDARNYAESRRNYFFADRSGIFLARRGLGEMVAAGDTVGALYPSTAPFSSGTPVTVEADGRLICLRSGPLVEPGDCLGHVARPVALQDVLRDHG
jgi:uncharacterized protein